MKVSCFLITGIMVSLLFSCDKNEKDKIDPRIGYTGFYKGKYEWQSYGHPTECCNCTNFKDTTINVKLGKTDTSINVNGREFYKKRGEFTDFFTTIYQDSIYYERSSGGTVCTNKETLVAYKIK